MCRVLYAAADMPPPQVLAQSPPAAFRTRPLKTSEEPVRVHFTKPHVYHLGAYDGCSCGFSYGLGGNDEEASRESVRQLGTFLADAVARTGSLELYACWDGDQVEPATERTTVTAVDFSGEATAFDLPERWFATVVVPAHSRGLADPTQQNSGRNL